jgi:protein SCO1/2
MSRKTKQGLILLAILVMPSLFYVILSSGEHDIGGMPYYGPREVDQSREIKKGVSDTNYYALPSFPESKIANGKSFDWSSINGQIKVISFAHPDDEGFRVMEQMQTVFERFSDKVQVDLLTFYLGETLNDSTVNALRQGYSPNNKNWRLLKSKDAKTFAFERLLIDSESNLEIDWFNTIVLVDQNNHIRGYYDGLQYVETKALMDGIKSLRFVEYRPVKTEEDEGE